MFKEFYLTVLYEPIYNALIALYAFLWNDFGVAIIALTIIIRLLLVPLSRKQITSQKEMQDLQPQIKEIQQKYKGDREKIGREQMALYKERGINPAAGCLPIIVSLAVFLTLYNVILRLAKTQDFTVTVEDLYSFVPVTEKIAKEAFGFLDLANPNYVLAVIAAAAVYYQIRMMQNKNKEGAAAKEEKEKKSDEPDFATIMQKQMLVMIPIMTLGIGVFFPAGLTLYWLTTTLFTIGQQWLVIKEPKSA